MKDTFPFEARKFVEKRSKPWTRTEYQFVKVAVTHVVGLLENGKVKSAAHNPRTAPMFWVEAWAEVVDHQPVTIGMWEYVTDGDVYYFASFDINDKTDEETYQLLKGDEARDHPRLDLQDKSIIEAAIGEYLRNCNGD